MKAFLRACAVLALVSAAAATEAANAALETLTANVQAADTFAQLAKAHTFTIYTRNLQRQVIDVGTAGSSLGDQTYANGNVYEPAPGGGVPAPDAPVVGRFDLSAFVTATINATSERRQVFIEVAFNPGVVPNFYLPLAQAKTALLRNGNSSTTAAVFTREMVSSGDSLAMAGVETYPANNAAILTNPIAYAVTGGTGALTGARGQVFIEYNATAQVFKYTFTTFL